MGGRGEGIINLFIVCNFVDMVKVNLVIHLIKHFCALLSLQISQIWGNKKLGVRSSQNPSKSLPLFHLKKSKQSNLTYSHYLYSTPSPSKQAIRVVESGEPSQCGQWIWWWYIHKKWRHGGSIEMISFHLIDMHTLFRNLNKSHYKNIF